MNPSWGIFKNLYMSSYSYSLSPSQLYFTLLGSAVSPHSIERVWLHSLEVGGILHIICSKSVVLLGENLSKHCRRFFLVQLSSLSFPPFWLWIYTGNIFILFPRVGWVSKFSGWFCKIHNFYCFWLCSDIQEKKKHRFFFCLSMSYSFHIIRWQDR